MAPYTRANPETALSIQRLQTFEGFHSGSFSSDNRLLALVDASHIDIVETSSGKKVGSLIPRNSSFLNARLSPDGRSVATAARVAEDPKRTFIRIAIWDSGSGAERFALPIVDYDWRRPASDLCFSPDGQWLASSVGGVARLWAVDSGKMVREFPAPTNVPGIEAERALLSPDGKRIAIYFRSEKDRAYNSVLIWNIENGEQRSFATEIYSDWRFSADSRLLAMTAIVDKGTPAEHSRAEIWDATTAQRVKALEVPTEWRGAYTIAFSPNSELLAVGGYKRFGIFAIDTGKLLVTETHHRAGFFEDSELPNQISHVEFSSDGNLLLTAGDDRLVKLWRITKR